MDIILIGLAIVAGLTLLYFFIVRPWSLNWGATKEEAARPLPGDEIVKTAHFAATRAIYASGFIFAPLADGK